MRQFTKQAACPTAVTLSAYNRGTLNVLARQGVAAHLARCEFCVAECALLARHDELAVSAPPDAHDACSPPVPLAVRLLAQTLLPRPVETTPRRRAA